MMEQIIDPQPKFLNSCCNLLSKNYCKFTKKVGCNWNWKVLKADKSSENIKKFYIKPFFLYDVANYRPPKLNFWNLSVIYFQKIITNFQKK